MTAKAGVRRLFALVAIGLVGLAACRPGSAPRPVPPAAKPPLIGLVDMGSQAAYAQGIAFGAVKTAEIGPDAAAFGGIVVNETWAQLEPTDGGADWRPLDASLAAVGAYNRAHPTHPLGVKLRIFAGFAAPTWAKSLGGAPVTDTVHPRGTVAGTLGRWWTPPYRAAWSGFQHRLAARYDSAALVRAVAVTSCATLTGEPVNTDLDKPVLAAVLADGWTPAAEQQCLVGAFADYGGWTRTPVDYAINPYRTVTAGRPVNDPAVTAQLVTACARSARPRCVVGNHGLRSTAATGRSATVYTDIDDAWQQTGGHLGVYFQTVDPKDGADCASIDLAVAHHATSVELWPPTLRYQGFAAIPATTLQAWDTALIHRAPLTCPRAG